MTTRFCAALLVSVLMVGALAMHVKVGDAIGKSLPAAVVLVLCVAMLVGAYAPGGW